MRGEAPATDGVGRTEADRRRGRYHIQSRRELYSFHLIVTNMLLEDCGREGIIDANRTRYCLMGAVVEVAKVGIVDLESAMRTVRRAGKIANCKFFRAREFITK